MLLIPQAGTHTLVRRVGLARRWRLIHSEFVLRSEIALTHFNQGRSQVRFLVYQGMALSRAAGDAFRHQGF
jgi:hypothetical protein